MRFERALGEADDGCLSHEGALALATAEGRDRERVLRLADEKRADQVGEHGTWVRNRNINFTDVCVKDCAFCSFRRDDGYVLSVRDVVGAGREAVDAGATEVTVQGGINPDLDFDYYLDVVRGLSGLGLHVHGFSPQEVHTLSRGRGLESTLGALRDAGLGSLPGTAAEVLVDEVRREICPSKISSNRWLEVVETAHGMGLPTTATIMFGHVESAEHRVTHLSRIRELQRRTGGFTEFVPLPFMPGNNSLGGRVQGETDPLLMTALSRLFLGPEVRNVQASWVKLGDAGAVEALRCGANDVGGTLMEEKISRRAGAEEGESRSAEELRGLICEAGLRPVQRDTLYRELVPASGR